MNARRDSAPLTMRRARKPINQINVVPYIDVMLVLLVIFMVTAPLVAPGEIELPSVGSKLTPPVNALRSAASNPDKSIVLIDESATQDAAASRSSLDSLVAQVLATRRGRDQPVVIDADKGARYEDVIGVLDLLQRNGVRKVGLLARPPADVDAAPSHPIARARAHARARQVDGADARAVRQPAVHRRARVFGVVAEPQARGRDRGAVCATAGEQRRSPQPKREPPFNRSRKPSRRPSPKPVPKPPTPVVEKPDTREADIALKAKREAERKAAGAGRARARAAGAASRQERKREEGASETSGRRMRASARRQQAKHARRKRARAHARAGDANRSCARRRSGNRRCAHRPSANRSCARRPTQEARGRAAQAAAGAARNKAQLDWIDKIRSRIRGNINLPPDIPGNPEAIFDVVQLPTGEIIDVKLRKSSGVRAYDDAVQRAILKSSPLPQAGARRPVPAQPRTALPAARSVAGRSNAAPTTRQPPSRSARACFSTIWIAAQLQSARCSTSWRSATV